MDSINNTEIEVAKPFLTNKRLLIILLSFLLLGSVLTYLNLRDNTAQVEQQSTQNYDGEYITGILPTGWDIEEIITDRTEASGGIDEKGLNGIEITKADKSIFEIQFVGGVGGWGACPEIFKFADTSEEFVDSIIAGNKDTMDNPISYTIVDLSEEKYIAINLFGIDTRLVYSNPDVNAIFQNSVSEDLQGFNPRCDEIASVANFPNLLYSKDTTFDDVDLNTQSSYSFGLSSNEITQEDAVNLATILNSLVQK